MSDINSLVLVGRLVEDSELRFTKDGTPVSKFRIANNYYQGKGKEDGVSFFDVTLWGKQAEALNPYLLKGKRIGVSGELRQERWDQDGQSRSRVAVNAQSIQLLDAKEATEQKSRRQEPKREVQPEFAGPESFEDDVIF
jgi:single-strand DNA-binding protein